MVATRSRPRSDPSSFRGELSASPGDAGATSICDGAMDDFTILALLDPSDVDFEAIATAAPCTYTRLTPQGVFLERLGITQRAQKLATSRSGDALEALVSAHRRLTHPAQMGNLFKVLGLFPKGKAPPPGLEV